MPSSDPTATLDQAALLTTAQLKLSGDVRVSDARSQRAVVKYQPGRNYLIVSPLQFKVLTDFTTARAVPGVLLDLIAHRRCPPLREFYELIVKAFYAGILQVENQPLPPEDPPSKWTASAAGGPARWLAILAMAAATATLFVRDLELPDAAWQLGVGWALSCLATSVGYLIAACVLAGAGGQIYHPRFHWKTLAPHFRVDLDDVVMTGQKTEIDVALVRMAPQFVVAAVAAVYFPPLLLPLLLGVFVHISPFWRSPMLEVLRALYRDPRLSTSYDFQFVQNRLFSVLLKARLQFADRTFLLICSTYTLVWLFLLFSAGTSLLNLNAHELYDRFKAAGGLHFTALALMTLFGAMAACTVGVVLWIGVRHLFRWRRRRADRKRVPVTAPVTLATVAELLSQTLLFRNLEAEELKATVGAIQAEQFNAGAYVVREGEPGDRLYIVYSGRVEVLREGTVNDPEPIAELQRGDIFGEMALLEGGIRRRSVRCVTPSVLLSLGKWEFDSLVFSRLSRKGIVDAVQKIGFLRRIPLSRHWSPHALTAFARCAEFRDLAPGEVVFRTGAVNPFFHLVQEGELEVVKDGKVVAKLGTGDFFGEISVLQDSAASATIIAKIPTRCLLVGRPDFLKFMSNDFIIGLLFEEIGSKRLGEPIFPFKRRGVSVAQA
jgi:CRP-like cAMP-binding protein